MHHTENQKYKLVHNMKKKKKKSLNKLQCYISKTVYIKSKNKK